MAKDKVIDPERFYTLGEIVREDLIPGVDTIPKASRLVQTDKMRRGPLRATMVARGENGVMYKVLGKNIIIFLAQKDE